MTSALQTILTRPSPFTPPSFSPVDVNQLHDFPILIIGAGGLGCELLKNLAVTGFRNIHVVDMDTVDISNLNRQFLFRQADVGESKADVAAQSVMRLYPEITVTPYHARIQDLGDDFYQQFPLVITGLDSLEARRWINATMYRLALANSPESENAQGGNFAFSAAMIDGGTEGLKGQSRVILYGSSENSGCLECSLDMYTKPVTYPLCTIANTPRRPEHCVQYASLVQFPKIFPSRPLDTDSPEDLEWVYRTALQRSREYSIPGVTFSFTIGVVKNIIPAIASTNAVIAASCTLEALKIITNIAPGVDNYMMYNGDAGIYTYTFHLERNPGCGVCGNGQVTVNVSLEDTLEEFIEGLKGNSTIQASKPSLRTSSGQTLYMQSPPQLEEQTRPNLGRTLKDLLYSAASGKPPKSGGAKGSRHGNQIEDNRPGAGPVDRPESDDMPAGTKRELPTLFMTDMALPTLALSITLKTT